MMLGFTLAEVVMVGVATLTISEGSRRAVLVHAEQADELPVMSAASALLLPLLASALLLLLYFFFTALQTMVIAYICLSSAMAVTFTAWPLCQALGSLPHSPLAAL